MEETIQIEVAMMPGFQHACVDSDDILKSSHAGERPEAGVAKALDRRETIQGDGWDHYKRKIPTLKR